MSVEVLTGPSEAPLVVSVVVTKEGVGCMIVVQTGLLEGMWLVVTVSIGSGIGVVNVNVMVVYGDLGGVWGLTLSVPVGRMRDGIHGGCSCEVQMLIFEVGVVVTIDEAATVIPPEVTVTSIWPKG